MAHLLAPDVDDVLDIKPENGKVFTLAEVQAIVGGDFQVVTLPRCLALVNEDGKRLALRYNQVATWLLQAAGRIAAEDYVVGNVLLCTRAELR